MLRMEIGLFLVLGVLSVSYFSSQRSSTPLHRTFGLILIVMLIHLSLDAATVYTVNHLDTVPPEVNEWLHRLFIGTMVLVVYLFYLYITLLMQEETGKGPRFSLLAGVLLVAAEVGSAVLPVRYTVTPEGNYSSGIHAYVCYVTVGFYLCLCAWTLVRSWKQLDPRKKTAIAAAMGIEVAVSALQALRPTWLISGMGLTLMTLSFYLAMENPEILRSELAEQKMSMLYLKSQVNPHFLYNTLDTIRIQAQLNGDKQVSDLLLRLSDFYRLSIQVDRQIVPLDDELSLVEAYLDLMRCRYPQLEVHYDIDPELMDAPVPNFILQPLVENSLLHGLKNTGYRGSVTISAHRTPAPDRMELLVTDTGSGFAPGMKEKIDEMLLHDKRQSGKVEGSGIGVINVHKRVRRLCGEGCGLSYREGPDGTTARLLLRIGKEDLQ